MDRKMHVERDRQMNERRDGWVDRGRETDRWLGGEEGQRGVTGGRRDELTEGGGWRLMELAATCRHVGLGVMMREKGKHGFQVTSSSSGRAVVLVTKMGRRGAGRVHGGYSQLCSREESGDYLLCPLAPLMSSFQSRSVAQWEGLLHVSSWPCPGSIRLHFRNARLAGGQVAGLLHDFLCTGESLETLSHFW